MLFGIASDPVDSPFAEDPVEVFLDLCLGLVFGTFGDECHHLVGPAVGNIESVCIWLAV